MQSSSPKSKLVEKEYRKTHKVFTLVMCMQVCVAMLIGFFTGTFWFGLITALLIASVPIYLGFANPTSAISRHAVAIGTQLLASLHMQQTMGMTEMHFQVFVLLAFLSFYRDWKVIVTGTLVVAVHHIGGFVSQHLGGGVIVFEDAQPAFLILLIHATFAIIECVVLSVMAHRASNEHKLATEINTSIESIMAPDGSLNLADSNIPENPQLHSFTHMLRSVKGLVERTTAVGEELLHIATKVQESSTALDDTVEQQNTQVGSIANSIRSISQSITSVADLSQNANSIADNAKQSTQDTQTAIESSRVNIAELKSTLETTSTAISDLSNKCENISDVMQSIKSVAEQTNLLALNAAIESARAGEHGRGFAVVADEVRNLAIKSKESAEEIENITSLLTESANHSVKNMDECVKTVDLAVESSEVATSNMNSVFSSIDQVNSDVTNVANSASEQAGASQLINQSTDELDNLFVAEKDQVTVLKGEVSQLNSLADELNHQLRQFKLA